VVKADGYMNWVDKDRVLATSMTWQKQSAAEEYGTLKIVIPEWS
jgi:hypothetical protein